MTKSRWRKLVGMIFVACWVFVLLSVTIMVRARTEEPRVELRLFWCIREAWLNRNPLDWYFVLGNIVLFIPIGLILPMFFVSMRTWWKTALVGFSFSACVEILQLVFHLGLFEWDDMINNTFGCVLGYALFVFCIWLAKRPGLNAADKIISMGLWVATIAFFAVALYLGQPVFDVLIK